MTWFEELRVLAFAIGEIRSSGGNLPTFKGEPLDTWLTRAVAKIERETLPRPLFEDGEPVQFGDRFVANTGEVRQVARITCLDDGRSVLISEYGHRYIVGKEKADGKRAKRPEPEDTWEELEKCSKDPCEYFGGNKNCKECPVELGNVAWSCTKAMAKDLVRRCKALAGVE